MSNLYKKIRMKYLYFKIKRSKKRFDKASQSFNENGIKLKEKLAELNKSMEFFNSKTEKDKADNFIYK